MVMVETTWTMAQLDIGINLSKGEELLQFELVILIGTIQGTSSPWILIHRPKDKLSQSLFLQAMIVISNKNASFPLMNFGGLW